MVLNKYSIKYLLGESLSLSLLFANQREGRSLKCTVSGRSPGFISFMFFASRNHESQSWRVGKFSFASAARTENQATWLICKIVTIQCLLLQHGLQLPIGRDTLKAIAKKSSATIFGYNSCTFKKTKVIFQVCSVISS